MEQITSSENAALRIAAGDHIHVFRQFQQMDCAVATKKKLAFFNEALGAAASITFSNNGTNGPFNFANGDNLLGLPRGSVPPANKGAIDTVAGDVVGLCNHAMSAIYSTPNAGNTDFLQRVNSTITDDTQGRKMAMYIVYSVLRGEGDNYLYAIGLGANTEPQDLAAALTKCFEAPVAAVPAAAVVVRTWHTTKNEILSAVAAASAFVAEVSVDELSEAAKTIKKDATSGVPTAEDEETAMAAITTARAVKRSAEIAHGLCVDYTSTEAKAAAQAFEFVHQAASGFLGTVEATQVAESMPPEKKGGGAGTPGPKLTPTPKLTPKPAKEEEDEEIFEDAEGVESEEYELRSTIQRYITNAIIHVNGERATYRATFWTKKKVEDVLNRVLEYAIGDDARAAIEALKNNPREMTQLKTALQNGGRDVSSSAAIIAAGLFPTA